MTKEQKQRLKELHHKNIYGGGLIEEEAKEYVELVTLRAESKNRRFHKRFERWRKRNVFWEKHHDHIFLCLMGFNVILCALGVVLSLIKILKG